MADAVGKKPKRRRKKKVSGRNVGPARERYWREHRLAHRKVRKLMKHCGMTFEAANKLWRATRTERMR